MTEEMRVNCESIYFSDAGNVAVPVTLPADPLHPFHVNVATGFFHDQVCRGLRFVDWNTNMMLLLCLCSACQVSCAQMSASESSSTRSSQSQNHRQIASSRKADLTVMLSAFCSVPLLCPFPPAILGSSLCLTFHFCNYFCPPPRRVIIGMTSKGSR